MQPSFTVECTAPFLERHYSLSMGKNKLFWETTNECGSMGFVAVHKSEGNPPIA